MSPAERERPASGGVLSDESHPVDASSRRLLGSTALAAVIAAVVLLTVVLPREYGFDPTRIGRVLGLTQKGEIAMKLAREAAAEDAAAEAEAKADTMTPPPDTTRN